MELWSFFPFHFCNKYIYSVTIIYLAQEKKLNYAFNSPHYEHGLKLKRTISTKRNVL